MNRKQREKNRRTSQALAAQVLAQRTCENCGEKGGHWVSTRGISLAVLLTGQNDRDGFWTCPSLYGEDGRRLADQYFDDSDEPPCDRCRGDGMDPWCDYLLPCPECQGEQRRELVRPR